MPNRGEIESEWWPTGGFPATWCHRRAEVSFDEVFSSSRIDVLICLFRSAKRKSHALLLGMLLFPALDGYAADLIAVVDAAGGGGNCGVARGDGNNPWGGVVPSTNPLGQNLGIVWLGTGKAVQGALGGLVPGPDTASCNDGSDPFMAIRPAACAATSTCGESGASSASKQWMIHFQGGGACKDGVECWNRWLGVGDFYSSCSKMSTNRFRVGGMGGPLTALTGRGTVGDPAGLASEISKYYNLVFLNYCSSDQWVGDQAAPVDLSIGASDYALYFQGHRILEAMVDRLMAPGGTIAADGQAVPSLAEASQIILAGDSAGAGGMVNNALWVFDELQANGVEISPEKFITVVDAGNDRPFEASGFDEVQALVKDEYDTARSHPDVWNWFGGNSDCANYHATVGADSPYGLWACGYSNHLLANHWRFPTMLREDLRDPTNGDQTLVWAQDTIENFQVYQTAVSLGGRLLDSRHPNGETGNLWFLGQWVGASDPAYSQSVPEIPADLMLPPEDGFTGIPEESAPPVIVTFAPNCSLHDAAVSNDGFFRHKLRTSGTWWHGEEFVSFHDILVSFVSEPDILGFEGQAWDWDTHDPRTWLDDTYGGESDCDNDGVVASEDCHDGDAGRQFDCDGDLLVAGGASPDCNDMDPGIGVLNDCDNDGEGSLVLGAGNDCNDMDVEVGSPALLAAGNENFLRGDGRNACFDLEDNDCDGLVDCDESECQFGCTRMPAPAPVPALWSGSLGMTTLLLLGSAAAYFIRSRACT